MKLKCGKGIRNAAKKVGRFVAPLLVAGIMAFGGGKANAYQKRPINDEGTIRATGLAVPCLAKKRCSCNVKRGDILLKTVMSGPSGRTLFQLKATKVDRAGVEFELRMESALTIATGKFRFNYDGTQKPKNWPATRLLKVKRTRNPNVAEVTLPQNFSWTLFLKRKTAKKAKTGAVCIVQKNPKTGDKIPPCARQAGFFKMPDAIFDRSVKQRLAEVRKKYNCLIIKPKVTKGVLKGLHVTTTLYGSGDTKMLGWLYYIATGVRPPAGAKTAHITTVKSGNKISASLILVFNQSQTLIGKMNLIVYKCENQAPQAWAIQTCIINESKKLSQRFVNATTLHSKKGARFSFSYWDPLMAGGPGWVAVPGCKSVVANNAIKVQGIPYNIGTCNVDKKLYKGRRLNLRVTYLPEPNENLNVAEARMVLDGM